MNSKLLLVAIVVFPPSFALADLSPEETSILQSAQAALKEAGSLYKRSRFEESGKKITALIQQLNDLAQSQDAEMRAAMRDAHTKAQRASRLLGEQGVTLPPLRPLEQPSDEADTEASQDLPKNLRDSISDAKAAVKTAGVHYNRKRYAESGKDISRAITAVNRVVRSKNSLAIDEVRKAHGHVTKARALLADHGVNAPAVAEIQGSEKSSARPKPSDSISFTKSVAPLLVRNCAGCHIRQNRGEYSLASFSEMFTSGESGEDAIKPGAASDSYLIQLVESGEMPPRRQLSADEVELLTAWVDAGAKYDGEDEDDTLLSLAPDAEPPRGGRQGGGPQQGPPDLRNRRPRRG
ncbi:MAG: hypothetical protein KDB27_12930 [Planctomycetales bacterium]|nr:hypothetical protein [Planctomycetales bacterium]